MTKQSNKVERPTNRGLTPLVTLQRAQKQACKRMVGRIDRDGGGGGRVFVYNMQQYACRNKNKCDEGGGWVVR